ncbi:NAD(P)H-quinone oxidoreductase [Streptomyces sp. 4N509B]|uniref:NAD(P)H-quinone oxidoreductase n=1 Tax=Streptomyces sp. 4N509B TaxID=3457413 RepID=UPI003FCF201E
MRAITVAKPGGPEVLEWTEVPEPEPAPGEVLIEVVAAGVNRADLLQRQGFYDPPPGASPYPGLECSGRVAALGQGVADWAVGDEVCALLAGGGYAERVVVPAGQVLPLPLPSNGRAPNGRAPNGPASADGSGGVIDLVEAAALPEVTCTVWANVVLAAGLRPGETLLVHGGGSGIGTMAVQLGRAIGARVAVTAGSAAKLARCRELGADILVNYREQDFAEEIVRATGGRGADVILDIMGGSYLGPNVKALATGGRIAVIGLQGGAKGELNLRELLSRRGSVSASSLRARPVEEKSAVVAAVREHVWPLLADGRVRPVVDRLLPLSEAREAHRVMEAGEHTGKILLTR